MEFSQFAFWLLCGLLIVVVTGVGWFFQALIVEIRGMRCEMNELNQTLAKVVINQEWHGKEILRLETRLNTLEDKDTNKNLQSSK